MTLPLPQNVTVISTKTNEITVQPQPTPTVTSMNLIQQTVNVTSINQSASAIFQTHNTVILVS
jgi:hypothetical protein